MKRGVTSLSIVCPGLVLKPREVLPADSNKFELLLRKSFSIKRDNANLNRTIKSFPFGTI